MIVGHQWSIMVMQGENNARIEDFRNQQEYKILDTSNNGVIQKN